MNRLSGQYVPAMRARRRLQKARALTQESQQLLGENERLRAEVTALRQALDVARLQTDLDRERVEALLHDTSHRIGNSLATVSSLLGLQLIRSTSDDVRQALEAARSRVHAIASSYRRLSPGTDQETASADEFLQDVLQDLARTASSEQAVSLVGEGDAIAINARDATTLGILVGELVTNALRHAFPHGRGGRILVLLQRDGAGVPRLRVIDDGVGMDSRARPGEGGLGSVIIKQLAQQFGGVPEYERRGEGGLEVSVPLPNMVRAKASG